MDLIEELDEHTARVSEGQLPEGNIKCRNCGRIHNLYSMHERRSRHVLVIMGCWVKVVVILLGRLKCHHCEVTFTDYPEGLLPYKRYITKCIKQLCQRYHLGILTSLRDACRYKGSISYGYVGPDGSHDERQLSPTTLLRWMQKFPAFGTMSF